MFALVPFLAAAAAYGLYSSRESEVAWTRASVDGRKYLVLRRKDSGSAANVIATVRRNLLSIVERMRTADPDDEAVRRLARKYRPDSISEGSPSSGYTSYTVDKGARVVMCIRQSDGSFVPMNVVMYVAVHELAHIMTNSVGHSEEFWANNARILKVARELGLYEPSDLASGPQPYCGIHIEKY